MKLKIQFIAGMAVFGTIVLIVAASVAYTNSQIAQLNGQVEIARRIERGTADLSYLSNDYFLYQESQQLDRWQSKFMTLNSDIASLDPTSDRGLTLAANLEEDILRLETVFGDVVTYLDNAPRNVSVRVDPEFQVAWRRMAVQTQTLSFDASQLSQILLLQVDQAQQTNILLILTLFGVFGVYFLTNYMFMYRRTLRSISELQAGVGIIGSGNFDYIIPPKSDDEIGELSQSFNKMTTNLKLVTASKTELEREVTVRKKAEEQLRKSNDELVVKEEALRASYDELSAINEELAATEEELRTANERVQEHAGKLEVLVEERTAKLHESEERLRGFMNSATEGFAIYDGAMNLVEVNKLVIDRFLPGTRREDVIGRNINELYPGIVETEWYSVYLDVIETSEPRRIERMMGAGALSDRILEASVFKVGDGIGVISRDVTDVVNLEDRLRKSESIEAVGKLTAMLAHDLRNPLNFISQASELARNQPEKADRMLKLIGESAARSLSMIENLRASTREISIQKVSTDLVKLIEKIVEETRVPENIRLEILVGKGLGRVNLDAGLVRRVLDNLISNAVEVMPDGGVIKIRASSEGGSVRIDVVDTGAGITDEAMPHIFESFYTTKAKGLGLGLPFSRRAVEAHGGTLSFTTRHEVGTTFTVVLPMR